MRLIVTRRDGDEMVLSQSITPMMRARKIKNAEWRSVLIVEPRPGYEQELKVCFPEAEYEVTER